MGELMNEFEGPFLGFTFDDTHSSTLGIVRVSEGSRLSESLLPTMQDVVATVPGRDGSYYFGSTYTQKKFTIPFAFNKMTADQLEKMRELFSAKQPKELVFDEAKGRVYMAKVTGTALIKYIPFEGVSNGAAITFYKGEGSVEFTCYYPYALGEEGKVGGTTPTTDESGQAVPLKRTLRPGAETKVSSNIGDVPVYFKVTTTSAQGSVLINGEKIISWDMGENLDAEVVLNTQTGLALGSNGKVYNNYFSGDLTAKLPVEAEVTVNNATLTFRCEYY